MYRAEQLKVIPLRLQADPENYGFAVCSDHQISVYSCASGADGSPPTVTEKYTKFDPKNTVKLVRSSDTFGYQIVVNETVRNEKGERDSIIKCITFHEQ